MGEREGSGLAWHLAKRGAWRCSHEVCIGLVLNVVVVLCGWVQLNVGDDLASAAAQNGQIQFPDDKDRKPYSELRRQ